MLVPSIGALAPARVGCRCLSQFVLDQILAWGQSVSAAVESVPETAKSTSSWFPSFFCTRSIPIGFSLYSLYKKMQRGEELLKTLAGLNKKVDQNDNDQQEDNDVQHEDNDTFNPELIRNALFCLYKQHGGDKELVLAGLKRQFPSLSLSSARHLVDLAESCIIDTLGILTEVGKILVVEGVAYVNPFAGIALQVALTTLHQIPSVSLGNESDESFSRDMLTMFL